MLAPCPPPSCHSFLLHTQLDPRQGKSKLLKCPGRTHIHHSINPGSCFWQRLLADPNALQVLSESQAEKGSRSDLRVQMRLAGKPGRSETSNKSSPKQHASFKRDRVGGGTENLTEGTRGAGQLLTFPAHVSPAHHSLFTMATSKFLRPACCMTDGALERNAQAAKGFGFRGPLQTTRGRKEIFALLISRLGGG